MPRPLALPHARPTVKQPRARLARDGQRETEWIAISNRRVKTKGNKSRKGPKHHRPR